MSIIKTLFKSLSFAFISIIQTVSNSTSHRSSAALRLCVSLNTGLRLILSLLALGLLPYAPVLANTGITVEWEKTFDGKTWGRADSIIQMPDGGFAVTNQSFTKSDPDVWLLKLDSGGHWQWEHSFSGSGYDLANAIIPTRDRGFALVGNLYPEAGVSDVWIIKQDSQGNQQWAQTLGGKHIEQGKLIIQTRDGGFAVLGLLYINFSVIANTWFIKLDGQGNREWDHTFEEMVSIESIIQTRDGGFMLLGNTIKKRHNKRDDDVLVLKLDQDGKRQWAQSFGEQGYEQAESIIQTQDGGFALAINLPANRPDGHNIWVIKLDNAGNQQWKQTGGSLYGHHSARSLIQTRDDGFVLAGKTDDDDVWITQLDSDGQWQWAQTFGGSEEEGAQSIIQTADGGFALVGYRASKGTAISDVWVIKLSAPSFCHYRLNPKNAFQSSKAEKNQFKVNTAAKCSWTATSNTPWITLYSSNHHGQGEGTLTYSVYGNPTTQSRHGTITLAAPSVSQPTHNPNYRATLNTAQRFTIKQSGNQAPTADFSVSSTQGQLPLTIVLDGSRAFDPDGTILDYAWTVNGQTFSGQQASIRLTNSGEQSIVLTVTDNAGLTATLQKTILVTQQQTQAPIARFTLHPQQGEAPLTVNLDANGSTDPDGSIRYYVWIVNGQTYLGEQTAITFTEIGDYPIVLMVTDNTGLSASTQKTLTVTESIIEPPKAYFTITPDSGTAPLTVTVDASDSSDSNGSLVKYAWQVSDGRQILGQTQSLTFTDSGHYDITLSVTDNDGITTSHQETVIIKAPVTHDNPNETGHFAQIAFQNQQDTYQVGESVVIALTETHPRTETDQVDLWIAVQLPTGELLFRTDNPLMPWHPKQQAYKTGIAHTETHHDVFDFEVAEGMGGDYFLYAVYVKTGENPISNDLSHRSNLADKKITLDNH